MSRSIGVIIDGHLDLPDVGIAVMGDADGRSEVMSALAAWAHSNTSPVHMYHALVETGPTWTRYTVYAESLDEAVACLRQRFGSARTSVHGVVTARSRR